MDRNRLESFTKDVQNGVSRLESTFESSDSFEEVSVEATNLWELLDEGEDVLDELDLTNLPDIVDAGDVSKAIDVEDLPDAISKGDPKEAIDTVGLIRAIELRELWSSTDMRKLWREAREFDDAVSDFTGDSDDGDADDGMLSGMDAGIDADVGGPGIDTEMDSELYQSKIQSELHDSVESFREKLLETRNELATIKAENESKGNVGQPNSRNPTAVSTMGGSRPDMGKSTHFSTVPKETRYSSAPNSKRIYGTWFEEEDDA
ncbi:hypothetical protein [Haladaptatus pallidirubidus]|uniref:Uncharacterized protein n=2 Tax=Haladaptatus pallidirubidus TaxID=1008152 RepID=A0AAV3UC73_9EURY|nr:hypothetical protein [Haladaptatus pallidirubidus]